MRETEQNFPPASFAKSVSQLSKRSPGGIFLKAPAFQFYADDFIGGTVSFSAEETGGYIRLLCYQWGRGRIPETKIERDRVAGCSVSDAMLEKFPKGRNKRMEDERRKQRIYRKKQRENGAKGGRPRKETQNNPPVSFGLSETEPKKSSPSPSPSPDPLDIPKELHSEAFTSAWQRWMTFRRGMKRCKNWAALFSEQLNWLKQFGAAEATEILGQSIRNDWQGLFERKHETNQRTGPQRNQVDRNAGTLNAGKAHEYANVGKRLPIPDPQRPPT